MKYLVIALALLPFLAHVALANNELLDEAEDLGESALDDLRDARGSTRTGRIYFEMVGDELDEHRDGYRRVDARLREADDIAERIKRREREAWSALDIAMGTILGVTGVGGAAAGAWKLLRRPSTVADVVETVLPGGAAAAPPSPPPRHYQTASYDDVVRDDERSATTSGTFNVEMAR